MWDLYVLLESFIEFRLCCHILQVHFVILANVCYHKARYLKPTTNGNFFFHIANFWFMLFFCFAKSLVQYHHVYIKICHNISTFWNFKNLKIKVWCIVYVFSPCLPCCSVRMCLVNICDAQMHINQSTR